MSMKDARNLVRKLIFSFVFLFGLLPGHGLHFKGIERSYLQTTYLGTIDAFGDTVKARVSSLPHTHTHTHCLTPPCMVSYCHTTPHVANILDGVS